MGHLIPGVGKELLGRRDAPAPFRRAPECPDETHGIGCLEPSQGLAEAGTLALQQVIIVIHEHRALALRRRRSRHRGHQAQESSSVCIATVNRIPAVALVYHVIPPSRT